MWKFGRNIVIPRWHVNCSQVDNKNVVKPVITSSFKKKANNSEQQEEKKSNDGKFRRCSQFQYLLFKSQLFETARWLGTASVLCFSFHQKHITWFGYDRAKSHCILSRNVLAMPEVPFSKKSSHTELLSADTSHVKLQKEDEQKLTPEQLSLKAECDSYRASYENSAGLALLKKDDKRAFRYFQSAARLGSGQGYFNLGLCYELGRGTKVNLSRAAFCYRRAAMQGHGLASFNLAVYFMKGIGGLPVDREAARILLETAAEKNITEAQMYLGLEYLEEGKWADAYKIFEKLSQEGVLDAKYYLSFCYENGWGTDKNEKAATEILSQNAALGHRQSISRLSKFYEEGIGGCSTDLNFALALSQILADQGDKSALKAVLRVTSKKDAFNNQRNLSTERSATVKNQKSSIHISTSVPELEHKKDKTSFLYSSIISAYLGLITPVRSQLAQKPKPTFYIGEEDAQLKFVSLQVPTVPSVVATS